MVAYCKLADETETEDDTLLPHRPTYKGLLHLREYRPLLGFYIHHSNNSGSILSILEKYVDVEKPTSLQD